MAEGLGEDLTDLQRSEIAVVNEELDREDQPRPENLTIFVIGRTGTGKSTLINSLLELEEEKNRAKVVHGIYSCKHDMLEKHEGFFCGVPTTIYDSRGLGDPGFDSAVFLKKFDKAVKEHGDRYLVFICQRFEDRLDDSVQRFGELMARKFKKNYEIWKKSILVLAKANKFTYSANPGPQATAEEKEIAKEEERLKMMINVKEWCVNFKSCLTKHGVPEEIISRMLVCPTGNHESMEIALFKNWKEELMEICIETEKDWDIYRQKKSPHKPIKEITGGVLPVLGPPIGMAIETLLAEESKKREIKKCEAQKANDESLDFATKEKKFTSFFKRILNRP